MNINRLKEIITKLAEDGEKAQSAPAIPRIDSTSHLTTERKLAWAQLLSSAASAEESEEMVVLPVLKAFEYSDILHRYLKTHMEDESRHRDLLKEYVKNNFSYEKKKKTLTDIIIYKGIFRGVNVISEKRPLPIIVAILFYEWFAEEFYAELMNRAGEDKLINLKNLFIQIEKDELRHRAGIKALLGIWKSEGKKIDKIDIFYTKILLGVTRLDVNTASWAFYNKRLRRNLTNLGLDTEKIYRNSKAYADKAIAELEVQAGLN
ncbi:MAG: ferritin-like domain-containing protein [Bacteriovorax sp.]|nr:ferritin-like domain-containing protein [Bacteriovorax sp.]